jgi:uncharacterized protein (DUF934 family)
MANLIKDRQLVANDPWQRVADDETITDFSIISLTRWQENQNELKPLAQAGKLAVHLESSETADLLGNDAQHFALITIDFPKFADGRGYSAARLLRERHGYEGELRSVGDVLIDQLFFMQRCGFTSFALREDQDLDDAIAAFNTFSVCYQNDVNDPRPLYRRR